MIRWLPLLAALVGVAAVAASGLTWRSLVGTALEDQFYGFFLDRYPLFLFASLYGAMLVVTAATAPGLRRRTLVTAPLGLGLFLAACLYPTFGGLVLRPGFFAGGMAFLTGQPLAVAYALGTAASAAAFGLALGAATLLARARLGWRRGAEGGVLAARLARRLLGFLTLWWGALVLGAPQALGAQVTGSWPGLPLQGHAALVAAALVLLALLPHAATRLPAPRGGADRPA